MALTSLTSLNSLTSTFAKVESIIVDNVIVQEIDGYSGEEFFLSIMGKTDPITK